MKQQYRWISGIAALLATASGMTGVPDAKLILSSWYYLHTFSFTDQNVTAELLRLPLEKRFVVFARGLDRIHEELKQRGLADTIATAEIFNEVSPRYHGKTADHEETLDFLQTRHPDIRFSLDTDNFDTSRIPRNARVWTYHSYYLWPEPPIVPSRQCR